MLFLLAALAVSPLLMGMSSPGPVAVGASVQAHCFELMESAQHDHALHTLLSQKGLLCHELRREGEAVRVAAKGTRLHVTLQEPNAWHRAGN